MKFPIPTVGEMVKINRGKMGEMVGNGGNGDKKKTKVLVVTKIGLFLMHSMTKIGRATNNA